MLRKFLLTVFSLAATACTTTDKQPPLQKVAAVDLNRFMGDWYVLASIPTFVEKGAHNALENYKLLPDGTIAITFTFRKDAFDGELKTLTMKGTVVEGTGGAEWKVSPFWPLKLPYYTIELDPEYRWVVVATPNRGYLWIMARQRALPDGTLEAIINRMVALGFPRDEIKLVPQQ